MALTTTSEIVVGILSDTHLSGADQDFIDRCQRCFGHCDVIIHGGDLTEAGILSAFNGKEIYSVHGNMCSRKTRELLPTRQVFEIGGHTFGLTHGAGLGFDIEASLLALFPEADCIVYGHTHRPVIHRYGDVLIINPGSFRATSPYGAPGTYAILRVGQTLSATIHEVGSQP